MAVPGHLSIVAGVPGQFRPPDPAKGRQSNLAYPSGLALDGNGDLYIADTYHGVVSKLAGDTHERLTEAGCLITRLSDRLPPAGGGAQLRATDRRHAAVGASRSFRAPRRVAAEARLSR